MTLTATRPRLFEIGLPKDASPYFAERGNTKEPDLTKRITHGGVFEIPWMDSIIEEGKARSIRYIASCSTIYVDEQNKNFGYTLNYGRTGRAEDNRSRADFIRMVNGIIEVYPEQSNLLEYLQKCNYNGSNPNRKKDSPIYFYYTDIENNAKKAVEGNKSLNKAKYLIDQLEGHTSKLNDLARLFSIDTSLTEAEIIQNLHARAEGNPDLILTAINSESNSAALVADKCIDIGLVVFDGHSYKYAGTKDNIKGFSGRQKPEIAFKSFVNFLQSDEGSAHYANLQNLLKDHAAKAIE